MPYNLRQNVLLVGCGQMAVDYYKVLREFNCNIIVVGRSEKSALSFMERTGVMPIYGSVKNYLESNSTNFSKAIVAVGVEGLKDVTIELIDNSIRTILVEKPAGLNFKEIYYLEEYGVETNSQIFVAYNRRFYSSVQKAKEIIVEDGGVTSFNFEFTEWSHVIANIEKAPGVKENWFLANSTHVVDLAFYLGGKPKKISCYTAGGLGWHPKASIFAGAGITENGALFSYQSNWEAPGRWGVEILTKKKRLILRPLEKLQIQKIGSINIDCFEIDDNLDSLYKPGLFNQIKEFINGNFDELLTLSEHKKNLKIYEKILE